MKYYCIKQYDVADCGAACLATVAWQYRSKINISKVRNFTKTDAEGTTAMGIVDGAQKMGFKAKCVECTIDELSPDLPLPCIAHVIINEHQMHYIVIHKISDDNIVIADPARGIIKIKREEFNKNISYVWTGVIILLVPGDDFVTYKKEPIIKKFFALVSLNKRTIIKLILISAVINLIGIGTTLFYQFIIDNVIPSKNTYILYVLLGGMLLVGMLKSGLMYVRGKLMLYLGQDLDRKLMLDYYKHIINLPLTFFSERKKGDIISRFNDAGKIRETISSAVITLFLDGAITTVGAVFLFIQNRFLFFIILILVVIYVILILYFDKRYEVLSKEQMNNNAELNSYIFEGINGIQTIKACNIEQVICNEVDNKFEKMIKSSGSLMMLNNCQGVLKEFVGYLGCILLFAIGSLNVMQGQLTVGELITFYSLYLYFQEPLNNLVNLQPMLRESIVAMQRISEITEMEVERLDTHQNNEKTRTLSGNVVFSNVDFRYGYRKLILNNINLAIEKGKFVAIVGDNGSGKSSLAKLILKFYNFESGHILVSNSMLSDISTKILREQVLYVSRDSFLFSGTIVNNICMGCNNIDEKEFLEICKVTGIDEFIADYPLGYKTYIDENGSNLSGGQRQKIVIARALIRDPAILILDEATCNLDVNSEKKLIKKIREYKKNMTLIIIAHRLNVLKDCDEIFVVNNGKVVEHGTHNELSELKGKYSSMLEKII